MGEKTFPQKVQFLLTIMKLYIHEGKCLETVPSFCGFTHKVKVFTRIEMKMDMNKRGVKDKGNKTDWRGVLDHIEGHTKVE